VGTTAAATLADRGADVTLYERDEVGAGSTARSAGVAYHAHADRVDASLTERSLERFRELSGEGSFRFHEAPYCWFVTEPGDTAAAFREQVERMRDRGCEVRMADPAVLRTRFPQLRVRDVHLAAVAERGGWADPSAYADLLADRARAAGATVREGVTAAVATDPPRVTAAGETTAFDAVVVAAGAETASVLADAGVEVPLGVYRTQAVETSGPAVPLFYDATEGYYARPGRRGIVAGDGAAEATPGDWDRDADDDVVESLVAALERRVVNLDASVTRRWAGLCTVTPDRDPLLGAVGDGLYAAAGWRGSGFMRAPATGERVAEQVLGGDGIARFDPERFDGGEETSVPRGIDDVR
jgi:sarcosine oxidase subunit beta